MGIVLSLFVCSSRKVKKECKKKSSSRRF